MLLYGFEEKVKFDNIRKSSQFWCKNCSVIARKTHLQFIHIVFDFGWSACVFLHLSLILVHPITESLPRVIKLQRRMCQCNNFNVSKLKHFIDCTQFRKKELCSIGKCVKLHLRTSYVLMSITNDPKEKIIECTFFEMFNFTFQRLSPL